jgi:Type IV secretion-system coupling protein DNA-binding domain
MVSLLNLFRSKPQRSIPWGPWDLPLDQREDHFLLMGTAGAGKTLSLTQLYAAILPHINTKDPDNPKRCERALIYDKKGDTLPILYRLKERGLIHAPIYYFNPQDSRSHAWDIAADVNTLPLNQLDGHFHRIVSNLFPPPARDAGKHASFFRNQLVGLAKLVLHGFAAAKIDWTLRDLFAVLYDEEQRKKILALHPRGQLALRKCGDAETRENIEASIAAEITPYGELSELMQLAAEKKDGTFSIHEWLTRPSILVFSGTTNPDIPLAHLNRIFLTELVEYLAHRPDTRDDITWIFLDEAASIGRQERFPTLLRECRSKGASVFLGVQDISSFRAALGKTEEAEGLLAQIKNVAFFKMPDDVSAEWASRRCGEDRRIDPLAGNIKIERRFPYTEFQDQIKFKKEYGLTGIFRTGESHPTRATIMPLLLKDLNDVPNEWKPLGSKAWPEEARPKPNAELEKLLGSPLKRPPRETNGRMPTTGRILAPSSR